MQSGDGLIHKTTEDAAKSRTSGIGWLYALLASDSIRANVFWRVACFLLVVTLALKGTATYSLFKGPVGVGIETAFGTTLVRPLSGRILFQMAQALVLVSCIVLFRWFGAIGSFAFRVFLLLVVGLAFAQLSGFQSWGKNMEFALSEYDLIVHASSDQDYDKISNLLGHDPYGTSMTYDLGNICVRVPPRMIDRLDSVMETIREAGYAVSRRQESTKD